jgi:hypothetical protein
MPAPKGSPPNPTVRLALTQIRNLPRGTLAQNLARADAFDAAMKQAAKQLHGATAA